MGIEQHYHQETTEAVDIIDTVENKAVNFTTAKSLQKQEEAEKRTELGKLEDMFPDMFPNQEILGDPTPGFSCEFTQGTLSAMAFLKEGKDFESQSQSRLKNFFLNDDPDVNDGLMTMKAHNPDNSEEIIDRNVVDVFTEKLNTFTKDLFSNLTLESDADGGLKQEKIDPFKGVFADNVKIPNDIRLQDKSELKKFNKINFADYASIANDYGVKKSTREGTDVILGLHNMQYDEAGYIKIDIPVTKTVYPLVKNKKGIYKRAKKPITYNIMMTIGIDISKDSKSGEWKIKDPKIINIDAIQ